MGGFQQVCNVQEPWKKRDFLRLLQNPIKTTLGSSGISIKMPRLGQIIGVSRKMLLCKITIILKILLLLNLRRNCDEVKN